MELPGDLVAKLLFKVAFSRHEAYNVLGACCPQIPALAMEAVRFETRAVEADLKMSKEPASGIRFVHPGSEAFIVPVSHPQKALAALAPTARDQRLQAGFSKSITAIVKDMVRSTSVLNFLMNTCLMSFAEQMDLALRLSRASEAEEETPTTANKTPAPPDEAAEEEEKDCEGVLLRLVQPAAAGAATAEPLQVVLRESSAGEEIGLQGQLRHNCEQIALKLARADWLLLYEGVALEAQLRARTMAFQLRQRQPDAKGAVQLLDLEVVLLQLPVFGARGSSPEGAVAAASAACVEAGLATGGGEEEASLRDFLQTWEDFDGWASSLEEHLGPLDLEVSRERSNNLQRGQSHTPYVVDLCRLAFRNFAICEGRLFISLALALYSLIARALRDDPEREPSEDFKQAKGGGEEHSRRLALLEALHNLASTFAVHDDALALQRSTLEEYRYYLLEPLERACQHFDLLEN
ncbi:unnamed protein product [Symbiodinium natans]|uniref:Uncharacterized protein n=1 Tax=Symbiodinium natans TaxID=878477 RepID=A0A812QFV6_9DINO|nr:unnamed protein product [Symbiodinium natans]